MADAPRWQDFVTPLVRSERARLEEHLAWARKRTPAGEADRQFCNREIARIEERIAPLDAALERLAIPSVEMSDEKRTALMRLFDAVDAVADDICDCKASKVRLLADLAWSRWVFSIDPTHAFDGPRT